MVQQVLQRFELQHSTVQRTLFPLTTDSPDPFLTSRLSLVVLTQSLWAASWRQDVVLTGHCDSSYADDAETHRSTQGYCFSLGSGAVSWRSTRSSSVSTSSAEAEIYAGAMAAQELRWLTFLLTDLSERPSSAPTLFTDNKATILLCQEPRLESRVKHINVRVLLLNQLLHLLLTLLIIIIIIIIIAAATKPTVVAAAAAMFSICFLSVLEHVPLPRCTHWPVPLLFPSPNRPPLLAVAPPIHNFTSFHVILNQAQAHQVTEPGITEAGPLPGHNHVMAAKAALALDGAERQAFEIPQPRLKVAEHQLGVAAADVEARLQVIRGLAVARQCLLVQLEAMFSRPPLLVHTIHRVFSGLTEPG
ncbi:unnamed protein product [Closterium sp. NIES-54]